LQRARVARAKQRIVDTAVAGQILAGELGITDAVNCFTKVELGGCVSTAVNILASSVR
jgi:hypothetical protein